MVATLLDAAALLLHRSRSLGTRFFHRFGLHCATHQIRIILISCVVITSLFYPALALYSSTSHRRSPSTPRLLAFLAGPTSSGLQPQNDLDDIWSVHPSLLVRDDAVSRARCGIDRTLRVERILIRSPSSHSSYPIPTALSRDTLLTTLFLERHIQRHLSSTTSVTPCLRSPSDPSSPATPQLPPCFVISPLSFWRHDQQTLISDPYNHRTLGLSRNISLPGGLTLTPNMVLAARGTRPSSHSLPNSQLHRTFPADVTYLALTFFFPETDCLNSAHRNAWLHLIDTAAKQAAAAEPHKQSGVRAQQIQMQVQTQEPTIIALEYAPKSSRTRTRSPISAFVVLAYSIFFLYVAISMRRMTAVHSRIGLTFTALVEIAVSTITSLSICALVGFRVTLVPWGYLPIVIVFVGAENMFNLVDAVSKTSVTLPVKERIALGLSHAGTSNTLKVVSYNAILGTLAILSPAGSPTNPSAGAVRQFCAFAIVVLVAHWFLAHTFFMAVLSIDIQRLELVELLRQNASLTPAVPNKPTTTPTSPSLPHWRKLIIRTQNILRGRATKNISLLLLLAITAALYYTTYPAINSIPIRSAVADPDSHVYPDPPTVSLPPGQARTGSGSSAAVAGGELQAAWHVWKLFNPDEDPFVHLRIEPPTVLTFVPDPSSASPSLSQEEIYGRKRLLSLAGLERLVKRAAWACYIVVFPIAVTTGLLYGLLLYLLKDAELLEAQRHKVGSADGHTGVESTEGERELSGSLVGNGGVGNPGLKRAEGRVRFWTLGRVMAADLELMAASKRGKIVVGVSTQDEVFVWRMGEGSSGDKNTLSGKGKGKGRTVMSIDVTDVLLHQRRIPSGSGGVPSTITAVAVSGNGDMCAVGTGAGVIAMWTISADALRPFGSHLVLDNSSSVEGIVDLRFVGDGQPETGPAGPVGRRSVPSEFAKLQSRSFRLLAVYESGMAAMWTVNKLGYLPYQPQTQIRSSPHLQQQRQHSPAQSNQQAIVTRLPSSRPGAVLKCMAVRVHGDERYLIVHTLKDGTVEMAEAPCRFGTDVNTNGTATPLTLGCTLQAGTSSDPVTHVHACRVEVGDRARLVIGVATVAGVVSVWDGATGECISTFDEAFGGVSGIRVMPVAAGSGPVERKTCRVCGERLMEGIAIVLSVGDVILVYRGYVGGVVGGCGTARWCVCVQNQPANGVTAGTRDIFGRRSRSTSIVGLSTSASPSLLSPSLSKRGKLPQASSDSSPFPVSGHGVHSRRASEKESMMRRTPDVLVPLPVPLEEEQARHVQGGVDGSGSVWQNVVVVRTGHVNCEKGAWDIVDECVIGVRRRVRRDGRSGTGTSSGSVASASATTTTPQQAHSRHSRPKQELQGGLTAATLERWDVWVFDPLTLGLCSSQLGSILVDGGQTMKTKSSSTPASSSGDPDATPRLPFTRVSAFLVSGSCAFAGLGNTVGVFACTPP